MYVIDLSLITKYYVAQIKTIASCYLSSKLVETIYFVSVNNYLSIDKYNIFNSCNLKTNNFLSAILL